MGSGERGSAERDDGDAAVPQEGDVPQEKVNQGHYMNFLKHARDRLIGATVERERCLEFAPPQMKLEFEEILKRDVLQILLDVCGHAVKKEATKKSSHVETANLASEIESLRHQLEHIGKTNADLSKQDLQHQQQVRQLQSRVSTLQGQLTRREQQLNQQRSMFLKHVVQRDIERNLGRDGRDKHKAGGGGGGEPANVHMFTWDDDGRGGAVSPPEEGQEESEKDLDKDRSVFERNVQLLKETYEKEKHTTDMRHRSEVDELKRVIQQKEAVCSQLAADAGPQHQQLGNSQAAAGGEGAAADSAWARHHPPPVPISVPGSGVDTAAQTELTGPLHTPLPQEDDAAHGAHTLGPRTDDDRGGDSASKRSSGSEAAAGQSPTGAGGTPSATEDAKDEEDEEEEEDEDKKFEQVDDPADAGGDGVDQQSSDGKDDDDDDDDDAEEEDDDDEDDGVTSSPAKQSPRGQKRPAGAHAVPSPAKASRKPPKSTPPVKPHHGVKGGKKLAARGRVRKETASEDTSDDGATDPDTDTGSVDRRSLSHASHSDEEITRKVPRVHHVARNNVAAKENSSAKRRHEMATKAAIKSAELRHKKEVSKLHDELKIKEQVLDQVLRDMDTLRQIPGDPALQNRLESYHSLKLQVAEKDKASGRHGDMRQQQQHQMQEGKAPNPHAQQAQGTGFSIDTQLILDLRREINLKGKMVRDKQHEVDTLRSNMQSLCGSIGARMSSINLTVVDKLKSSVDNAELAEELYRVSGWALMAMGLKYNKILTEAIQGMKQDRALYQTQTSLRKVQRAVELMEYRYAVCMASQRSERLRLKDTSNRSWDRVLFYARSLVKKAAPVADVGISPHRSMNGARPATAPSQAQQQHQAQQQAPVPAPFPAERADARQRAAEVQPGRPQPNPPHRPASAPNPKRPLRDDQQQQQQETAEQRRDRILAMLYRDRRQHIDLRIKERQKHAATALEPVFEDAAKVFRLVGSHAS